MAEKDEVWDDSALVEALDDAISKYKIMHLGDGDNGSPNEERITEENLHSVLVESNISTKSPQKDTTKSASEKRTSEAIEQHASPSNGDHLQEADGTYTNTEYAQQYNALLNQYNAVEEQRQKLLQQLYQYGNWDYQGYGYGSSSAYDSQYQTAPAPQTSEPPVCSCRPYLCPYSTAAVSSPETCVASTALAHNGNSVSLKDDDFIKPAMGAVNRALCSFNKQTSEGKKVGTFETDSGEIVQGKSSQTDLSAVLNAWFSAGFHTGMYLSEQASAKK